MSVITNKHDDLCRSCNAEHCSICKEQLVKYPFISWRGGDGLFFCSDCCASIKDGLMADLVQVAAIVELQGVAPHYQNYTLVRKHIPTLEKNLAEGGERSVPP